MDAADKPISIDWESPCTYGQRFLIALFPCGLLMFIYWFFGPLELIHVNRLSLGVDLLQALPYYAVVFILLTPAFAALLALLKQPHYETACKTLFAIALASYIQGNFLNPAFGLLNGASIDWHAYIGQAYGNYLVWAAVCGGVFAVAALARRIRFKLLCGLCAALILMQAAALTSEALECARLRREEQGSSFYFSTEKQFVISASENVIVFVLDSLSSAALKEMVQVYPDRLDFLSDFTYYNNCAPSYYATFPEMTYLLTGSAYDYTNVSHTAYRSAAWADERAQAFYKLLKEKGYSRQIFTDHADALAANYNDLEGCIDNVAESVVAFSALPMFREIFSLTNFRYLPLGLKACYLTDDDDFRDMTTVVDKTTGEAQKIWNWDGIAFYDALAYSYVLSLTQDNIFSVYCFKGAHPPYTVSEAMTEDAALGSGLRTAQCYGMFRLIDEFIAQLPKEIYDNATIIILADHGDIDYGMTEGSASAALFIKQKNEKHDLMSEVDTPVSHASFIPTIVKAIAPERAAEFGVPFDEATADTASTLIHTWYFTKGEGFHVYTYDHGGDINAAFNAGWDTPVSEAQPGLIAIEDAVDYFYN